MSLKDIGELKRELKNFNLKAFLDCAIEMVRADEVERALWLLNNLPAFYRDHVPIEVLNLRNLILSRIGTPNSYRKNDSDLFLDQDKIDKMAMSLRAMLIKAEVKLLNKDGLKPHIVDYGPGEYWVPVFLKNQGLKFTYDPIFLHDKAFKKAEPLLEGILAKKPDDAPTIFLACEIIEHLWHEADIKADMLNTVGFSDIIHVSTPKYTFDPREINWQEHRRDLGHLRAYTPNEFTSKIAQMFKEYHMCFYDHTIMHIRLSFKETKFKEIKERETFDLGSVVQ